MLERQFATRIAAGGRHRVSLAIAFSLFASAIAAQSNVDLKSATDALNSTQQLGLQSGANPRFPFGNNATRISAASIDNDRRGGIVLPGGDFEIPETVVLGGKWGTSLRGSGGIGGPLGDAHYASPKGLGLNQSTRLVWTGADGGTICRLNGGGAVIADLSFRGCRIAGPGLEPLGEAYPPRAKVGLQINSSNAKEAVNGAKCKLSHLEFYQVEIGILVGPNAENPRATDYVGARDNHADTIYADDIHLQFPFSGKFAGVGTGVWIRNQQSLGNYFSVIHSRGNPEQIFWLERGGKTHVGMITHSGVSGHAVRVGLMDINGGGLTVGHVGLDAAGKNAQLLKNDIYPGQTATGYCEIQSANIPPKCTAVPQIDVGPGTWTIRNCNYLQARSIKMTGQNVAAGPGYTQRICHVHLENVTTFDCDIDELVDASSAGPYLLTWRNCHRFAIGTAPTQRWGIPFEDSTAETELTSAETPVRRRPFGGE